MKTLHTLLARSGQLRLGQTSTLLLGTIACVVSLLVGAVLCWRFAVPENVRASSQVDEFVVAEMVERSTVVRPIEDAQSLKAGDLVVVRPNSFSPPTVQQVAVKANQTVVIRRGGAIESLYMLGEKSGIVVASENDTRLVQPEQLSGTLIRSTNN